MLMPESAVCLLQMQAISTTTVLITSAHDMADLLTFMQPKTTAIVFNHWQTAKNTSMQSRGIYYWNVEFLTIEYFPVLMEDYSGTTDRPDCEMVNENIYDQVSASCILQSTSCMCCNELRAAAQSECWSQKAVPC